MIQLKLKMLLVCICISSCSLSSCSKERHDGEREGYLSGTVKNSAGMPLKDVTVIADHSIFYNSNMSTKTDEKGAYRLKVRNGSWYAFAQHRVEYNGKLYSFYLYPDNSSGFGGEGAERHFTWKLTGEMPSPLSGQYGGLVTIDNYPGVYIDPTKIEFVFKPTGLLVDGSSGTELRRKANDGHNLQDLPIGRYEVTASYQGQRLLLRKWNSDETFVASYILDFEPQIPAQCDNCAKLEYTVN